MSYDMTKAKALEIAERRLLALGWRFSLEDVGKHAAIIISSMEDALAEARALKERP